MSPMEPTHVHSLALHHQVRDHLEEKLTDPDHFVWINVRPTGDGDHIPDLNIAGDVDRWLGALADADPPEIQRTTYTFDQAAVRVTAIPKVPEARGGRSHPIVGNPEPVVAGYGP